MIVDDSTNDDFIPLGGADSIAGQYEQLAIVKASNPAKELLQGSTRKGLRLSSGLKNVITFVNRWIKPHGNMHNHLFVYHSLDEERRSL